MQLARDCMKYSIKFLKLNFTFIILLQVVKLILVQENRRALLNFDGNVIKNESNYAPSSSDSSPNDDATYSGSRFYNRKLNNELVVSLSSWYSYDIKQMEATKTEILNIITNRQPSDALADDSSSQQSHLLPSGADTDESAKNGLVDASPIQSVKPILITTSLVNFNELLQFNNLKNVVKLAILLNLNLTCILTNLLIVSFIILRNAESPQSSALAGNRSFRYYMRLNLNVNMFLFLILLLINTVYLIILNNYNRHSDFDSIKWIRGLVNMNSVENDEGIIRNLHAKFETSNITSALGRFMQFLLIGNAKINVFFMIISICLLFTYGYLIKLDCKSKKEEQNTKSSTSPVDDEVEKQPLVSSEELPVVDGEKGKLPIEEIIDPRIHMVEMKQRKLERIASMDLQWIMHLLLMIYLLSVWDIAEVYQYMQEKNAQSTSLDNFLANNAGTNFDLKSLLSGGGNGQGPAGCENNLIVLNKLNYDYINMQLVDLMRNNQKDSPGLREVLAMVKDQNVDINNSSFILNKINKYYYNYNSKFYHHSIDFNNKLEFGNELSKVNTNGTITNHQKLKSVTKIKILFILKKNTQLLSDILIVFFSFIVLFKLKVLNKLNKFYSNLKYLKYSREQTLI